MTTYRNASDERRTWGRISRPDGRTLELDPGEEAELELADDFSDHFLVPVVVQSVSSKPTFQSSTPSRSTAPEAAPEVPVDPPEAAAEATDPKE